MNKSILVGLAILSASTSAASAWTHRTHHSRAAHPAVCRRDEPGPVCPFDERIWRYGRAFGRGGQQGTQRSMKSLHDSGYDSKRDLTPNGDYEAAIASDLVDCAGGLFPAPL